jgi:hypothetical protein
MIAGEDHMASSWLSWSAAGVMLLRSGRRPRQTFFARARNKSPLHGASRGRVV